MTTGSQHEPEQSPADRNKEFIMQTWQRLWPPAGQASVRPAGDRINERETALRYARQRMQDNFTSTPLGPANPQHAPNATDRMGPDETISTLREFSSAFPDWEETLIQVIAEGDWVVLIHRGGGTHAGNLRGLAPTNRQVGNILGIDAWQVDKTSSRVIQHIGAHDQVSLMAQLGLFQSPGGGAPRAAT